MAQETQTGALYQPRGVGMGKEMGGRLKRRGYSKIKIKKDVGKKIK